MDTNVNQRGRSRCADIGGTSPELSDKKASALRAPMDANVNQRVAFQVCRHWRDIAGVV